MSNIVSSEAQNLTPPLNASNIANPASIIWGNYVDLTHDVKPYLQIPSDDTTRDTTIQMVIDFVCQQSQQMMGKPIAPTTFFGRFDGWSGWNGAYVMLPYYPVLGVQKVAEWWGTSGPNYLSEQTPENQVWGFNIDAKTGMLTRTFPGLVQMPWFPGARSIEVTWTAGYNPVPMMFKMPALEVIREWWTQTQQASRSAPAPAGFESEVTAANDTYPGLPRRVKATFSANAQVGMA